MKDLLPPEDEPGGVSDNSDDPHDLQPTPGTESVNDDPQEPDELPVDDIAHASPAQLLDEPQRQESLRPPARTRKPSRRLQEARETEAMLRKQSYEALFTFLICANDAKPLPPEPLIWEDVIRSPERDEWLKAVHKEIQTLDKNGTFRLEKLPPGRRSL